MLTWYTASGWLGANSRASEMISKYGIPGLTIMISAPSSTSRICNGVRRARRDAQLVNCMRYGPGPSRGTYDRTACESTSVWWQLVALAVTKVGHRTGCLAEGAIHAARKLGRVRHEVAPVAVAVVDQGLLDRTNTTCTRENTI